MISVSPLSVFQSTLPRGERQTTVNGYFIVKGISIHAPARGATASPSCTLMFTEISIHAPARGATLNSKHINTAVTISIHAPARGATISTNAENAVSFVFQSTLPRGERRSLTATQKAMLEISIHAPARGATFSGKHIRTSELISIHAPARGATTG